MEPTVVPPLLEPPLLPPEVLDELDVLDVLDVVELLDVEPPFPWARRDRTSRVAIAGGTKAAVRAIRMRNARRVASVSRLMTPSYSRPS